MVPCFDAAGWPEADALFRGDGHWLGADGASTVDLGEGRILWLFADTWVDASGSGNRRDARMVSNTAAVQKGTDPASAHISFYWGTTVGDGAGPLFPDRQGESLWPGQGVRVGERLVLFFARTARNTGTGLGFEHTGWTAALVDNPGDAPPVWRIRWLGDFGGPDGVIAGYAGALLLDDHLYAFGARSGERPQAMYALRWPVKRVAEGDLAEPEGWAGVAAGWVPAADARLAPLFREAQTELSIIENRPSGGFLAVQSVGFGPAVLAMRAAGALTGPWSGPRPFYEPPERARPDIMIYAARAHPVLTGADVVATYATNSLDFGDHFTEAGLYYPRFVRLARCAASP